MTWDDLEGEAFDQMKGEMKGFFDNDDDAEEFTREQWNKHVKPAFDEARAEYGEDGAGRFAEDMEKEMNGEGPSKDGEGPSGKGGKGGKGEKPAELAADDE